ncbi:TetR/AcrR family transcriptional regulator [Mycobacterium nebraskense]|uniref:TetR family transcriptional regulator n=1 Tax=Mycobacterium nebraskense TaxID=244292 RepID=A0A0F5NHW5_9MYCO|nr:TetR/AcrR family transcriptional regulator [Mycobacterium nebraskense]KKC06666.1 TetR family transcriptional regulator [Mycobacterium nebraskense]KLO36470.1 TetR family transcriptional regulator [Mycobacterium nebraskense]MBI2696601.1 TetR/AcrR family transcriptional regulator [Mycobacterium nebraskense]MCV7120196.1 TetR/AcrR family transcriptional regulator [Mycobacterium nebraskense]ORW25848.1 TetR family transcriptional regulator [Mycobacterium nebraskense]
MPEARGGRPRDVQLDDVILDATRELLAVGSYAELSMDGVAARAKVGKKTLYRRWSSKAPLVAEAVIDAYGRGGSFDVPTTGDLRADLRTWLVEHAEFIADPASAALIRALIAAAAASTLDNEALDQQLSVPQRAGLLDRLRLAADDGQLRADADIDAVANALMGTLLLRLLSRTPANGPLATEFDGLLDAILGGILR